MLSSKLLHALVRNPPNKFRQINPLLIVSRRYGYEDTEHKWDAKEHQQTLTGNREQVTFGLNGQPGYVDRADFPFPAIRYKESTPEIEALKGKERGDWRLLTIEEKKLLYRANFCQTFAEFQAPTGEWKNTVCGTTLIVCLGIWAYILMKIFVYSPLPNSFNPENKAAQLRRMIDLHTNPITGLGSEWDYEKKDWKRIGWSTPQNPFKDPCTGEYMEEIPYDEQ